ncbi:MAG: PIN domain-containing protein [Anaerolineaceae bacterium]|nr:PIN domain-containing protein [Anaerolineaceae bacterium]
MNYLLDTNHWIYLQQNNVTVLAHIQTLSNDVTLYMSVVNQAELLTGVKLVRGKRRQRELQRLYEQTLAQSVEILDITPAIGQYYASIFVSLRSKGKPIPTNDIWIAATAQAHHFTLVSNDEHFRNIENLRLENWV